MYMTHTEDCKTRVCAHRSSHKKHVITMTSCVNIIANAAFSQSLESEIDEENRDFKQQY